MSRLNFNGRAMSVSNTTSQKNSKVHSQTNVSDYKPTLVGHQVNQILIPDIYDVFQLHFPKTFTDYPRKHVNLNNLFQILSQLLQQLKNEIHNQIFTTQTQYQNIQMQLKLVRDARNDAVNKIKLLENELHNVNQKLKSKELDSFAKNEQIFKTKQKIERIEKQIVMKNMEVKNIFAEWQDYRNQAHQHSSSLKMENAKLKRCNKKLKQQIQKLQQRMDDLQADTKRNMIKINKFPKVDFLFPDDVQANPSRIDPTYPRNRSHSTSLSQKSQLTNKIEKQGNQRMEQLQAEVNELKENQSALLDRLAERDKLIQRLQYSLSNSVIQ